MANGEEQTNERIDHGTPLVRRLGKESIACSVEPTTGYGVSCEG